MQEKKQLLYTISVENYHCISNITTFPYNTNARNKLYILGLYQEKNQAKRYLLNIHFNVWALFT